MEKAKYIVLRLALFGFAVSAIGFGFRFIVQFAELYGWTVQQVGATITSLMVVALVTYWLSMDYDMKNKYK